jgi:multiple sugar transport system permease protein
MAGPSSALVVIGKERGNWKRALGQRLTFSHDDLVGFLFASPWIIGFIIFTAGPFFVSLYLSFTDWDVFSGANWVGISNYHKMFTDDRLFRISLWNTIYYVLFRVPGIQIVSLGLALLLNQSLKGISVYRTVFYLPAVTSGVATAILWTWIFNGTYGVLNLALAQVGIQGPNWLFDLNWSMPALILMSFWGAGQAMIIYLAGLQDVPVHLYEAAEVDGATTMQKFLRITVPILTPSIFFNMIRGFINSFQVFTAAYIMTRGGPANRTLFYVLYLYRRAFESLVMGYASALAWILFLIILAVTLGQLYAAKKWVYYESGTQGAF